MQFVRNKRKAGPAGYYQLNAGHSITRDIRSLFIFGHSPNWRGNTLWDLSPYQCHATGNSIDPDLYGASYSDNGHRVYYDPDGSADYFELDGNDPFPGASTTGNTDPVSIAWCAKIPNLNDLNHNPYFIRGDKSFGLKHNTSRQLEFVFFVGGAWKTCVTATDGANDFNDKWVFACGTWSGIDDTMRLYVNGVEYSTTGSVTGWDYQSGYNFSLFKNTEANRYSTYPISWAALWARQLSADEIHRLHLECVSGGYGSLVKGGVEPLMGAAAAETTKVVKLRGRGHA